MTLLSFGYDAENRLISITDQFGKVTSIVREGDGSARAIGRYNFDVDRCLSAERALFRFAVRPLLQLYLKFRIDMA